MPSIFHPFYCQTIIHHSCEYRFIYTYVCMFSSVQSLSHVWLFAAPWTAGCQASLSITNSWSLLKLMSITSVMPSKHLILCQSLLLSPSISPSMRVFSMSQVLASSGQSTGVSASPSVLPMNIQDWFTFWIDWFDLLAVQVQKHQFFCTQLSLYSNSHIHIWLLEKP